MKIDINYIADNDKEKAVLNLHKENKRQQQIINYLENDGLQNYMVTVTQNGKILYLSSKSIYYVEAEQNVRLIYTKEEVYHTQYRLYELEGMFPGSFVRISKSSILNIDYVKKYKPLPNGLMAAEMINGNKVYISRKYVKELLEKIER